MAGFSVLAAPDVTAGTENLLRALGSLQQQKQFDTRQQLFEQQQDIERQLSDQRQKNIVIERLREGIKDAVDRGDEQTAEELGLRLAQVEGRVVPAAPPPRPAAGRPAEGGLAGTEPVAPRTTEIVTPIGERIIRPTSEVTDAEFEATLRAGGEVGGIELGGRPFEEFQASMRQMAAAVAQARAAEITEAGGGGIEAVAPETPAGRQIVDSVAATGQIAPTELAANALRATREVDEALGLPAPRTAAGRAARQRAREITKDEQLETLLAFAEPALRTGDADLTLLVFDQIAGLLPEETQSEFAKIREGIDRTLRSKVEQRQTIIALEIRTLEAKAITAEAAATEAQRIADKNRNKAIQARLDEEADTARTQADSATADAEQRETDLRDFQASAEVEALFEKEVTGKETAVTPTTDVTGKPGLARKKADLLENIKRFRNKNLVLNRKGETVDSLTGEVWLTSTGIRTGPAAQTIGEQIGTFIPEFLGGETEEEALQRRLDIQETERSRKRFFADRKRKIKEFRKLEKQRGLPVGDLPSSLTFIPLDVAFRPRRR